MTILAPEIGTTYGSLDSTAFADGGPYSAHLLRCMARGSNRLVSKGHEAFNLVWPTVEADITESFTQYPFETIAPPFWAPLHPPIPHEKKPGLVTLNIGLTALILDDWEIQFQVGTRARPFRPDGLFSSITADGDNDFDEYDLTGLDAAPDGFDETEIWFRGVPDGTLVSTASVGTPNSSSSTSVNILQDQVVLSSASWNVQPLFGGAGNNNLAENGTAVVFLDGNGLEVCAPRLVIDVDTDRFWFAPLLSLNELAEARRHHSIELRQLPRLTLANIVGYYTGRTS